jgi:hypothetical protein
MPAAGDLAPECGLKEDAFHKQSVVLARGRLLKPKSDTR